MNRLNKTLILALSLLGTLAACSHDYVQECRDLYEKVNNFKCIKNSEKFDLDIYCPDSYNESGNNYTAFFKCLEEQMYCDGDGSSDSNFVRNVDKCMF